MKKLFLISALAIMLASCEDVVEVELDNGTPQLVVDAWLNNLDKNQIVNLQSSVPYFDNSTETFIADATVRLLSDGGLDYELTYDGNGNYIIPADSADIELDEKFILSISWRGNVYEAVSDARRVTTIDSITYSKEDVRFGGDDIQDSIWIAQFWGIDVMGVGDCYWVRSYKNDTLLLNNITTAYDAGTAPGSKSDNVPFILPIRFGINPDGDRYEFFQDNDTIRVELLSIDPETFDFWNILSSQINNGGLFATPPVNTPTNITKVSGAGPPAVGWFSVSMASTLETVLDPAKASESIQ